MDTSEGIVDIDAVVMHAWKSKGIEAVREEVFRRLVEALRKTALHLRERHYVFGILALACALTVSRILLFSELAAAEWEALRQSLWIGHAYDAILVATFLSICYLTKSRIETATPERCFLITLETSIPILIYHPAQPISDLARRRIIRGPKGNVKQARLSDRTMADMVPLCTRSRGFMLLCISVTPDEQRVPFFTELQAVVSGETVAREIQSEFR